MALGLTIYRADPDCEYIATSLKNLNDVTQFTLLDVTKQNSDQNISSFQNREDLIPLEREA